MVNVPVRAAPVLAAMVKFTLPAPLPPAPEVIVSHVALLAAVHGHPLAVDTATGVPVPLGAPIDCDVGLIEYVHDVAAWLMVKVWPPIVAVPVRAVPVLAAALNLAVPLPLPLAPAVTVIQAALLVVVHVHPVAADTATLIPVAPAAGTDWLVGLMLIVQVEPDDPA